MVPYDASDHFEQIFLLYFDAGGRSLLIGDRLENCWLATSNSCKIILLIFIFALSMQIACILRFSCFYYSFTALMMLYDEMHLF